MSTEMIWIIAGIALILAELVATQIVAVFFGVAAIVVGLLMLAGIIEGQAAQFTVFAVLSLVLLFGSRRHLKRMLTGTVADERDGPFRFQENLGERVQVVADFVDGRGRVRLNGTEWTAVSDEPLAAGQGAYVVQHKGIVLTVASRAPASQSVQ